MSLNRDYEKVLSEQEQDFSCKVEEIKQISIPFVWELEKVQFNEATAFDYLNENDVYETIQRFRAQTAADFQFMQLQSIILYSILSKLKEAKLW